MTNPSCSRKRLVSETPAQEDTMTPGADFVKKAMPNLMKAVKLSQELPVAGTPGYIYYNDFPDYKTVLEGQASKILTTVQRLINQQNAVGNVLDSGGSGREGSGIDRKFAALTDVNDKLLETINSAMDRVEYPNKQDESPLLLVSAAAERGPIRFRRSGSLAWKSPHSKSGGTPASNTTVKSPVSSSNPNIASTGNNMTLLSGKNVIRPQTEFRTLPDNHNSPFVPLIRAKPNSIRSLEESMSRDLSINEEPEFGRQKHPYLFELENLAPCEHFIKPVESSPFPESLEKTEFVMVATRALLEIMLTDLSKQLEISVDLEHHSYRSFLGLTCLIQISTRSKDYIVDALVLREDLHLLNSVFTDPAIVKVLHGSDHDLMWLQRDLGVYMVQLFDTFFAAKALQLGRYSLSHLLQTYCDVTPNKEFQLADWRIRPLPQELIEYARSDTHYLLYIYDKLREQLANQSLTTPVWKRCRDHCLKCYEKPNFTETDYLDFYQGLRKSFNSRQLYALEKLFAWRDAIARLEDESVNYVLPNHMLAVIAEVLPKEHTGILACCNRIPPLVRKYIHDMHKLIQDARDTPLRQTDQTWRGSVQRDLMSSSLTNSQDKNFLSRLDSSHPRDQDVPGLNLEGKVEKLATLMKSAPQIPLLAKSLTEAPKISITGPLVNKICQLIASSLPKQSPEPDETPVVEEEEEGMNNDQADDLSDSEGALNHHSNQPTLLETLGGGQLPNEPNVVQEDVIRLVSDIRKDTDLDPDVEIILKNERRGYRNNRQKDRRKSRMPSEQNSSGSNQNFSGQNRNDTAEFTPYDYEAQSKKYFGSAGGKKSANYDPFSGPSAKRSRGGRSNSRGGRGRGGGSRPSMSDGGKHEGSSTFRGGRGGTPRGRGGSSRGTDHRGSGRGDRGKPRWK